MSQLAEASTSSKSRLSHAVARLEERGWVQRLDCETDRRGQVARLTEAGFAALEAAAPSHVEQVRQVAVRPAHRGAGGPADGDQRGDRFRLRDRWPPAGTLPEQRATTSEDEDEDLLEPGSSDCAG